jgi:hypothetical protein
MDQDRWRVDSLYRLPQPGTPVPKSARIAGRHRRRCRTLRRSFVGGETDLDRLSHVVIDDDDLVPIVVVKPGACRAIEDFGVAGVVIGLGIVEHDVDRQPEGADVFRSHQFQAPSARSRTATAARSNNR